MKSIQHNYNLIQYYNPEFSTYLCLTRAVSGEKFKRNTLSQWFDKLVSKEDYSRPERNKLIRHLFEISKTGYKYINISPRTKLFPTKQYQEWRKNILLRDNNTCVLCGSSEKLEVDHIKTFMSIVVENDIVTLEDAYDCDELWDLDNGRVLCNDCHRKTDTYGRPPKID